MIRSAALLAGVALAALFLCSQAAGQTEGQVYENQCEDGVRGAFHNLQTFFSVRWQARKAQLHDLARETYVKHHGMEDAGITAVYVFQTPMLPIFAVVAVKPVDGLLCIVKIQDRFHMEYTADTLHEILSTEDQI